MDHRLDPTREDRLVGLALAKGWIRKDQLPQAGLGELLKARILLPAQVEALERELDRGQAFLGQGLPEDEALTALGCSELNTPSQTRDAQGSGSSIFTASWIKSWAHFEDLVLLAEGGMGRIFRAKDTRLRRKIALKMLRREDPELQARFLREAELQARVNHPNVCRVYEAGEWKGQAYIAMELIEGETFKVAARTLDLSQKLSLMVQACEGVHAAHREGLIHRDLKPTNLMVADMEGNLRAVVLDFGLARPAQSTGGMTVSGMVMGTVHYMSPEQARGIDRKIDRRTDVYALGVTLYEMFVDHPPFHEHHGLEVISKILSEDPPSLGRLVDIPRDLDTVVMKCLEKEPTARYDTARALGDELQRVLEGEPILARRVPLTERMHRWAKKNRSLVAVGAVGLMAAMTFGTLAVRERLRAARRAEFARRYGQEAERIEALVRYVRLMPRHDTTQDLAPVTARMQVMEGVVSKGDDLEALPARFSLGRAYLALERPEEALAHLEKAWSQGFRGADSAYALGKALGQVYLREMERAERLPQAELRAARRAELEKDLLTRARELLREGRNSSLEPPAFQDGMLAFFEGREAEALSHLKEAQEQAGWLYEARMMEGDLMLHRAEREEDSAKALQSLAAAAAMYESAERLAPSDPGPCLQEARAWRQALARGWQIGRPGQDAYAACMDACGRALAIQPTAPDPLILQAWASAERGRERLERGEHESAFRYLNEAIELAQKVCVQDPFSSEPHLVLAFGYTYRGLTKDMRGETPESDYTKAFDEAQRGAKESTSEAFGSFLAGLAATRKMVWEIASGRAPWGSFEKGLTIALEASKRHPEVAYHPYASAILFVERAEYERTHGMDPRPSIQSAEHFLAATIALSPKDFAAFYSLGNALLIKGEYEFSQGLGGGAALRSALEAYKKAKSLNPRHYLLSANAAETLIALGEVAQSKGESVREYLSQMKDQLYEARKNNPSYIKLDVYEARGALLEAIDSPSRAVQVLGKVWARLEGIQRQKQDWEICTMIARISLAWPKSDPATDHLIARGLEAARRARELNPSTAEPWLLEGSIRMRKGDKESAESCFRKALALDANLRKPLESLGWRPS
jgi:tRNA A-37 threonylcarbamoyl transferase component Bud32